MTTSATRLKTGLRCLIRHQAASVLAETAMMLSVLSALSLAGVEAARFTLLHQKLERVAAGIGDMVAQSESLTETDIGNIMAAVEYIAHPFNVTGNGRVVVSAVSASNDNPPTMNWQRSGGGGYAAGSHVGTPGGNLTLPPGLTVANGDTVIVAEVIYRYTPWIFADLIGPADVYQSAFFRPRFGALTQIN
jgi:Flp pilus assembly protein TadG